jgi:hypothetical protein
MRSVVAGVDRAVGEAGESARRSASERNGGFILVSVENWLRSPYSLFRCRPVRSAAAIRRMNALSGRCLEVRDDVVRFTLLVKSASLPATTRPAVWDRRRRRKAKSTIW